ncbi:hypothetical protein BGW80DRAFT_247021 [Lactifluus volemus]|nr:hypothetical protein BGW80DRAFT_247021 [Lactifluus volemus]
MKRITSYVTKGQAGPGCKHRPSTASRSCDCMDFIPGSVLSEICSTSPINIIWIITSRRCVSYHAFGAATR